MVALPLTLALTAVAFTPDLGLEVQGYPAGVLTKLRLRVPLLPHWTADVGAGTNLSIRRDLGKQPNERGFGPGASAGLRYYPLDSEWRELHFGMSVDVYYLPIDFDLEPGTGRTEIVILQPTARVGWSLPFGNGWWFDASFAVGREFNVIEEGEPVGQDFIGLLGIAVSHVL